MGVAPIMDQLQSEPPRFLSQIARMECNCGTSIAKTLLWSRIKSEYGFKKAANSMRTREETVEIKGEPKDIEIKGEKR